MTNFPSDYDDDVTLPFVNDNIVEIGEVAVNALRDAIFSIEQEIGIGASGSSGSIAQRMAVIINPDGTLKPSAIASLGLVTLPITNSHIDSNAQILESKLMLDHRTADLFNYINDANVDINTALSWISLSGVKVEPHLMGVIYRHSLSDIDIGTDVSSYLTNRFREYRDNSSLYTLLSDINSELLAHQFADGSSVVGSRMITTNDGSTYSSDYSHPASAIFLNTSRFAIIPKTNQDLQKFADFIDSSSMFLYGTRIQNLYTNGISRSSRSNSFLSDINGQNIIPSTLVTSYLLNGGSSSPVDNISTGDDIIEFIPAAGVMTSNAFDSQFAAINVGDVITINYGIVDGYNTVEVPFVIKEKKFISGLSKRYLVRVNGKNLYASTTAYARVDKPLFYNNKYGVLACAAANNHNGFAIPSLIIGNPRSAMTLGLGFNPAKFDSAHYMLYLALYPTGNPQDGYVFLRPGIDVTGNAGITPGKYTLDSIVKNINEGFRQPGYNYRFIAFSYQGEIGIMLADTCNNSSFSIISAVVDSNGFYNQTETDVQFPNNVISVFSGSATQTAIDPLGFGPNAANIASPPFMATYGSSEAALNPTKLFVPLKKNNYYINGAERDRLSLEVGQVLDSYGDGYWFGDIISRVENPSPAPDGNVKVTYRISNVDLSTTNLKVGKTIVVQSLGTGAIQDCGRFIIESLSFGCDPNSPYTDITVYDAIHAQGTTPVSSASSGRFAIYFGYDSVSFNQENSSDYSNYSPFKRYFEVYVDQDGKTFTHERARISVKETLPSVAVNGVDLVSTLGTSKIDLIGVSPKLRGYAFGSVTKISLTISANASTGVISAQLSTDDGYHSGSVVYGLVGTPLKVYDETNIDYIEFIIDNDTAFSTFSNEIIDVQLYPSLALDEELMILATCMLDNLNVVRWLKDQRQFGNTSEKDLSTSALNFISATDQAVHSNGVISGFSLLNTLSDPNPNSNQIYLTGGTALVNGKLIQKNAETIIIPIIKEYFSTLYYNINWAICINDKAEYQSIPLLDYDAVLATPSSLARRFVAYDPATLGTYYIDGISFTDLINVRKDLTLLYIVASTVTYPTASLAINDCRKYSANIEDNLPLRYDMRSNQYQGNFRSISSLFNWLKYNSSFNGQVILKSNGATLTVSDATILGNSPITIDGEGETNLVFSNSINIKSNVTFKNINVTFSGPITITSGSSNIKFENCTITLNDTAASGTSFMYFNACNNVKFENCAISATFGSSHAGYTVVVNNNTTNFSMINTSVATSYYTSATVPPGMVIAVNAPKAIFENCTLTGNFYKAIGITNACDGVKIDKCAFSSTFDPSTVSTIGYDLNDLVNDGGGYIWGPISGTLSDVQISNCSFISTSSTANRHSFINIQLLTTSTLIENMNISGCKFSNPNVTGTVDDFRAAISIINQVSTDTSYYPTYAQPILRGLLITGNVCDRNQSIIITTKTTDGYMYSPGISTINCVVSGNTCGTIGYWVGAGTKFANLTPNVTLSNDKATNLIIENNTCHYIGSMNHEGKYFPATTYNGGTVYNMCYYPTGDVIIKNNNCNWIHTAITFEENSSIKILGNSLHAYDRSYLIIIGETLTNTSVTNAAIYVSSNKHIATSTLVPSENNDSCCIIDGNTTDTGYYMFENTVIATYYYQAYCIACSCSCTITNNILKGILGIFNFGHIISVNGKTNIVKNNKLYRGDNDNIIYYYISAGYAESLIPSAAAWDMANTSGIITENYFDSPYVDNIGTTTTINVPNNPTYVTGAHWIVERNINQTVTRKLRLADARHFSGLTTTANVMWTLDAALTVSFPEATSTSCKVNYTTGNGAKYYSILFELTNLLPDNVRLIQADVSTTGNNPTNRGSLSALPVVRNSIGPKSYPGFPILYGYTSAAEPYIFNFPEANLSEYINDKNGYLTLTFLISMESAAGDVDLTINYVQVKYRW